MGDGTHIGAVNAHAKGIGSHHDLDLVLHKGALNGVAVWPGHARVIGGDPPAGPLQAGGLFLGALAGGGIDDGGPRLLAGGAEGFGQQGVDLPPPLGRAVDFGDSQREVGPGKAMH